jgi:hypothetical protein
MLPSTRTPEGEPIRCSVCGSVSRVDACYPANDSVCPVCGTFALLQPCNRNPVRRYSWRQFRRNLYELVQQEHTMKDLARIALIEIAKLTKADRVAILRNQRTFWSSRKRAAVVGYLGTKLPNFITRIDQSSGWERYETSYKSDHYLAFVFPFQTKTSTCAIEVTFASDTPIEFEHDFSKQIDRTGRVLAQAID